MLLFVEQVLNGLQYGAMLFMLASGLTLIFGIMGVINLAHGSFYMIGAYMAFALSPLLGQHFITMLLAGVALTALISRVFFKEPLTWIMGLGIALIVGGVLLIEIGATH